MEKMSKEQIRALVTEYADLEMRQAQIMASLYHNGNDLGGEVDLCRSIPDMDLQIRRGIMELAEILGVETVNEREREDDEYPYRYWFEYHGLTIFEIEEEKLK